MRIIHVAGLSGSGKTTFIRSLIPELSRLGPVAAVKHIGHHSWSLEAERIPPCTLMPERTSRSELTMKKRSP